ncbi:hypothetical protein CR513_55350, partial [Mucuna pruriens]
MRMSRDTNGMTKMEKIIKRSGTNGGKPKIETGDNLFKLVPSLIQVHRQSSESIISNSSNIPEDGGSDTSLKLGSSKEQDSLVENLKFATK